MMKNWLTIFFFAKTSRGQNGIQVEYEQASVEVIIGE